MYSVCSVTAATSAGPKPALGWQPTQAAEITAQTHSKPVHATTTMSGMHHRSRQPAGVERTPSRRQLTAQCLSRDQLQQYQSQRRVSNVAPEKRRSSGGLHCACVNCLRKICLLQGGAAADSAMYSSSSRQSRSAHLRRYSLPVQHPPTQSNTKRLHQNRVSWPASLSEESGQDGWPSPRIRDTGFSETESENHKGIEANNGPRNSPGNDKASNGVQTSNALKLSPNNDDSHSRVYRRGNNLYANDLGDERSSGFSESSECDLTASIITSCSRDSGYSSMASTDQGTLVRQVERYDTQRKPQTYYEDSALHSRSNTRRRRSTHVSSRNGYYIPSELRRDPAQLRRISNPCPFGTNSNLFIRGQPDPGCGYMHITNRRGSINHNESKATAKNTTFSSSKVDKYGRGKSAISRETKVYSWREESPGLWDSVELKVGCWHGFLAKFSSFVKKLLGLSLGPQTAPSSSPSPAQSAPPSGKRQRGRGLFSSLLCCFRNSNSSNNNNNNNPPTNCQLPSSEDNGSARTSEKYLLPTVRHQDMNKKCVVIDLDETLVHSSFKPINNADFIVPVEIDGTIHQVYVLKRPHVDEFLQRMGDMFECVLFTASLAKYADPVADLLDKWNVFRCRLFRDSCIFHRGNYVKDLSRLGRELEQVVIVDNSPASYIFHPNNAVAVTSWFDEMDDTELLDLIPFFERLARSDNVYSALKFMIEPSPPPQAQPSQPQQQPPTAAGS